MIFIDAMQLPTSSAALFQSSFHKNVMKTTACSATQMTSPVHSPVRGGYMNGFLERHSSAKDILVHTYNPHICGKHKGHANGEADEVETDKIKQSTNQLFSCSSENTCSHALQLTNTCLVTSLVNMSKMLILCMKC